MVLLIIELLVGSLFLTLKMLSHFLASTVSDENSAINLIKDPLYRISCFSFSVFGFQKCDDKFNVDFYEFILFGVKIIRYVD